MKKVCVIFLTVVLLWGCSDSNPANNNPIEKPPFETEEECLAQHFWYGFSIDEKIFVDTFLRPNLLFVGFDETVSNSEIVDIINHFSDFEIITENRIMSRTEFKAVFVKTKNYKTCSELNEIRNSLQNNKSVLFANYTYDFMGAYIGYPPPNGVSSYTNDFVVKIINENDLTKFNELLKQTNTFIKKQTQIYTMISVTKNSKYDALKMAQYFFETGLFEFSHPNIWSFIGEY